MKKKLVMIIAIIAIVATVAVGLVSCNRKMSWDDYSERGYFILGFDENQYPMGFKENGEYTGFDIDLAKVVAKELGMEVKFQPVIWDSKEIEIKAGRIDVIWNGFTVSEDRKKQFEFSKSYMLNKQIVVVKSDSAYTDIETLVADADLKVAYQASSTAEIAYQTSRLNGKNAITPKDNDTAVLQELKGGRVDCVIMDSVMANYKFSSNSEFRVLNNVVLTTEEYAVGFRKGETEFVEKVNAALKKLYDNGVIENIFRKYFPDSEINEFIIPQ